MEEVETRVQKDVIEKEKDLARTFWQRYRKDRRYENLTKKRSRKGSPVPMKTTSMGPPMVPNDWQTLRRWRKR